MAVPFSQAILQARRRGLLPVVVDIKPVSPKDGALIGTRDPALLAAGLAAAGACALSVVTESSNFGGSLEMLRAVSAAVPVPVLRKDFLTSTDQVDESGRCGARAVLIILATTPDNLARDLYSAAAERGMEAVVEIHNELELERAVKLNPSIIGINNRDILALECDSGDVGTTERLAPLVPDHILTMSESSLLSEFHIHRAFAAGADAVLVGTAVLKAPDPPGFVRRITGDSPS